MALVSSSQPGAHVTNPTASLTQAISQFENALTPAQRLQFQSGSAQPDAPDVIAFVTQVDRTNQAQARRCVASRLCTFLDAIQQFSGVVGTFVSANPTIAALVWGSVKFTIVTASNVASYFDKVTSMIMAIGKVCPVYKQFGQLFADSVDLQHALCEYYAVVVRLCAKVVEVLQRNTLSQFLSSVWNPFEMEFKACRDELQQNTAHVDLRIQLALKQAEREASKLSGLERQANSKHRSLMSTFRTKVSQEHEDARQWRLRRSNRHKAKLRSSIKDNLTTINYLKAWKYFYDQRAPATAEWLQDDPSFLSWRKDDQTAILWCPGTLGIGKTVLVSNVIAHLQQTRSDRDIICYHFCDPLDTISLSARAILGTLAYQMTSTYIELASEDELRQLENETRDLDAKAVIDFLARHLEEDKVYHIILDGLDEAEHEDIQALAWSIAGLCNKRKKNLRILCAGRPELEGSLFRTTEIRYRVAITKSRLMHDIDRYSEAFLTQLVEDGALLFNDPTLILKILEIISTASEGMFLWTRLFIEEICAQLSDNGILSALEKPPRKISELVDLKMARVRRHAAAGEALKLLQYGGVLKRPLNMDEYQELLAISVGQQTFDRGSLPHDMVRIVVACYGLVSIDEEENTVRYIHHSIRQHLFSQGGALVEGFDEQSLDLHLGDLCLTYLDFNDFKRQLVKHNSSNTTTLRPYQFGIQPVGQSSTFVARAALKLLQRRHNVENINAGDLVRKAHELTDNHEPSRFESEIQAREFAFLQYARVYWVDHIRQLDMERRTESWKLVCKVVSDDGSPAHKPWSMRTPTLSDVVKPRSPVSTLADWAFNEKHHVLLTCALRNDAGVLTEQAKLMVLCNKSDTAPWFQLFSTITQRTGCHEKTLIRGLAYSITLGDELCVIEYLRLNIPLNDFVQIDDVTQTVLQAASWKGFYNIVERLITAGSNVNATPSKGDSLVTALQAAARGGHLDIVEILLTAGADVNTVTKDYKTALQAAAQGGHLRIVERLLTAGADVNAPTSYYGWTALQAAAQGGHLDVVERLLTAGADVNAPTSYNGRTALRAAAQGGHLDVLERLLTAGADVNAVTKGHGTALQAAAGEGHLDIVEILLTAGADVKTVTKDYKTALQAAAQGGHLRIVERLLTAGADVNAVTKGYGTALQAAAQGGHLDVVERLLTAGADVNAAESDSSILKPLSLALRFGHREIAETLRAAGAHE